MNLRVRRLLEFLEVQKNSLFSFDNKQYTPKEFAKEMQINPDNYITLTSFTHAPFYESFILNIPDNFSNGSFYNVPFNDMMTTIDNALKNGFTVELDCDVSEKTFSSKHGLAIIPEEGITSDFALVNAGKEKEITTAIHFGQKWPPIFFSSDPLIAI